MLFGFHDKRWLLTLYLAWIVVFPVSLAVGLVVKRRLIALRDRRDEPKDSGGVKREANESSPKGRAGALAALLFTLALTWFLWGPPWGGGQIGREVDVHESLHYKGIQAILSGAKPYVGAAADQYGPASQLFSAFWVKYVAEPSVIDLRVASLALHFIALTFFVLVAFRFLGTATALLGSLLAIFLYPSFSFFQFATDGVAGFWGWANVWRYAGLLLLGSGIPWVLMSREGRRRIAWLAAVGALWAVTFFLAQENALGGIGVLILLAPILIAVGGVTWRACARAYAWVVAGAGVVAAAYLLPYLLTGDLVNFVRNYFLVPLAVSSGYSNTPWWEDVPWIIPFYVGPIVAVAIGLCLAFFQPPSRGRDGSPDPVLKLAWLTAFGTTIAALIAQAGALTRSDSTHLVNAYVLFPFMVAAFAVYLARRVGGPRRYRTALVLTIAFAASLPFLLPTKFQQVRPDALRQRLSLPITSRSIHLPPAGGEVQTASPAERRAGDARTRDLGLALTGGTKITPAQAAEFADKLRTAAAGGTVYLDPESSTPTLGGHLGYWYFIADLTPFPVPYEEHSMVLTAREVEANRKAVTEGAKTPDVYVTALPDSPASRAIAARMIPVDEERINLAGMMLTLLRSRQATDENAGVSRP